MQSGHACGPIAADVNYPVNGQLHSPDMAPHIYCYATDDRAIRTVCVRGFKRMARRDDAHVRPDHHIVCDVEAAKVIESAVLIYEDIMPDAVSSPPAV